MSARPFFDTNVLVYLLAPEADRRGAVARELASAGGVVSVQVLNEFANVARRKAGLDWEEVGEVLAVLKALLDVRPLDLATHERGVAIAARYGYAVYDAMIIAAAIEAGADRLLTEDMRHGQAIEGVTISNPFGG